MPGGTNVDSLELNALPTHPTLLHPRTGEPLRAIGLRPNGQPLWPIMGGDGTEGDANDGNGDDAGNGDENTGDDEAGDEAGDDNADEDARVQRANRQAANYRTQLRETQQTLETVQQSQQATEQVLTALRTALGIEGEGDGDDPGAQVTELTGRVETLTSENASLRAELLVHDLAADNGGNPRALLDSRGFLNTLQGLDPEGENYRTEVADAIKDAVSKNAAYRATGLGSSRGGSELDGDRREQQRQRPKGGLAGAIGNAYSGK